MEVVIPTHNDYKHLTKTFEVLKTFEKINIIHVIDNASEEQIAQRLKELCESNTQCVYHHCSEL